MVQQKQEGTLYLIPNRLGKQSEYSDVLPEGIASIIHTLDGVFVENAKRARDFLSHFDKKKKWNAFPVIVFNKENRGGKRQYFRELLHSVKKGENWGILSDCGCPAIADPGGEMVFLAHSMGITVKPLVGPSSIVLAFMASGFSGQQFEFHGYPPKKPDERRRFLKKIEKQLNKEKKAHIFIEAPFRNKAFFHDICSVLPPKTQMCIASSLTLKDERIKTISLDQWKREGMGVYEKHPSIFLLFP